MKIIAINYIDISIMLILMAIPFSYFIFLGFRVFPFLVLLGYFFILLNLKKIGFQFVPAVFTAYFFAFLISLGFYELRLKKIFNSEITI